MNICPIADKCGGCTYQGVPYEQQLKEKEGAVRGLLSSAAFDPSLCLPIEPCPDVYRYRNKMDYTFGDEVKDGPLQLGMHKKKQFLSVVNADQCQIVPEDFNRLLDATLQFCRDKGYTHYHRRRHEGLLRYLILRRGVRTNQLLVNIVTSPGTFAEDEYVNVILSTKTDHDICGVLHTVDDSRSDAVNPTEIKVLYGSGHYEEVVMDLKFDVGPFSFFQTNVPAAERLYRDAIGLVEGIEGKTVYDLYCGTGTITQAMATKAGKVIGVEIVEEAVEAARRSAARNGLTNCEFICGDVLKVLDGMPALPDVIVVDPPRAGIHPKAMKKICSYGVKQIVYISCNPKTLVQNLVSAQEEGYEPVYFKPYDNFPMTNHIETIVLLQKLNS
ncbi:MAG: 23S rRNA (uracil(1939)-C(5))-methyltransferase RlmD [Firmicutes bacterium]|nr:23S rRNA (uracil(1939)-C(5))-methyltransferase RlmD [Bacillota bacterium]